LGWLTHPPADTEWLPAGAFFIYRCRRANSIYIPAAKYMTRQQVLDLYFLDARHKLIELAAFLDRVERAPGQDDFRLKSFRSALASLNGHKQHRAEKVLLAFSDPTAKPVAKARGKGACGAWNSGR
jgi:hypothetical protein